MDTSVGHGQNRVFASDPDVDWLDSSPVLSATYDYTKLGALEDMTVSANTDTFSYDPQELLSQVSYGGGGSSTMTWDADQQRQELTNSGGSTYFVYDPTAGVPAVLVETDGENETFYVREPGGELIARAQVETRQYYFFDRLGSTIAMVPAVEANPTDRLFYTPWGELVTSGSRASTVGTSANPYRYVGQLGYYYHHQDSGLQDWMQLGVRFYQPELGRFERRDSYEAPNSSAYHYAGARPCVAVDHDGRRSVRYNDPRFPRRAPTTPSPGVLLKLPCAMEAADDAQAAQARRFDLGHVGRWNGPADAFRHCVWACLTRKKCGAGAYNQYVLGHESEWNPWEGPMDLGNDEMGRKASCREGSCEDNCFDDLLEDRLFFLPREWWGRRAPTK